MASDPLPALWEGLAAAGVGYCLLRGGERLDQVGDVDLLVLPADVERLHDVAGRAGFALLRRWGQDTQHFLLGFGGGHRRVLHVVTEVGLGPPEYPWLLAPAGPVVARASAPAGPGPVAAAPPDELWVSVHHCLLDKSSVAPHHRGRLAELVAVASPDDPLASHLGRRLATRLLAAIAAGEWEALEGCRTPVRRAVARGQRLAAARRRVRRRAELRLRKVAELVADPALAVALLAPDGAGKSTVVAALEDVLPLPVRTAYLGLEQSGSGVTGWWAVPGVSLAVRIGRLWRRWLEARVHRARGRVVVFDRHPYDARLPRPGDSWAHRLRRWVLSHALPAPGLVIVLDAPGDVLHQRSGEHDPEVLDRQRRGYLGLVEANPGWVVVDACQPAATVTRQVAEAIWGCHLRRARAGARA